MMNMNIISLNGAWTLRQKNKTNIIPAMVPGCVHTDLLAAGVIDDPFYRDNEFSLQWISKTSWVYSCSFCIKNKFLSNQRISLIAEGLDSFAAITLNNKLIAKTDNQFRTWEIDIKHLLKDGHNVIEIQFDSPFQFQIKQMKKRALSACSFAPHEFQGRSYVRKSPANYGWDWGPALPTCGISGNIELLGWNTARLTDIHILQEHSRKKTELTVKINAEKISKKELSAHITVSYKGKVVSESQTTLRGAASTSKIKIQNPKLWWPNGMGDQPLYEVIVDLIDKDDKILDTQTKRIGLRTLNLIRKKDKLGESFHFKVNGTPFFAKGANWIPADQFPTRVTHEQYTNLLESAASANMNMIRVWGGGIYEPDRFYDICDELGLCVWQDFMFTCASYPTNKSFLHNVESEIEDNVRRMKHHPSIALWCGNNELEQGYVSDHNNQQKMTWTEYSSIFDKMLPRILHKIDPQRDYWPSSPHSPQGDRNDHSNPTCGDAHLWDVWHGRKPFEWYRTTAHRFCSEFGFQSFPEPATINKYILDEDKNLTSPIMEHHQRSPIGNSAIMQYMLQWFRMPKSFEMTLWLSQILQSLAIKYAVEHWRRNTPQCMGALYWQLNDTWPAASWSSIDYHGSWKALHYSAANFYAPILLSAVENTKKGTVALHISNDKTKPFSGTIRWGIRTVNGEKLAEDHFNVKVPAGKSKKVKTLELANVIEKFGTNNLLVWMELLDGDMVISQNLVTFQKPKTMNFLNPEISAAIKTDNDGAFLITIKTKKPALWTWLEIKGVNARLSDNFLHIMPGRSKTIKVFPTEAISIAKLKKNLTIRSLIDTY